MAGKSINSCLRFIGLLSCLVLVGLSSAAASQFPHFRFGFQKAPNKAPLHSLVRISIVNKFRGPKETVEINGKRFNDYSPLIIQSLSATGVVLDQKGDILTFLGYRWLDIQGHDPGIEVTGAGQKWKGKLIGIDQRNGVAVIRLAAGKLRKTPTCNECEVKDGTTLMAPVSPELSQLKQAQVVSIGARPETPESRGWKITVDRPFPDIGQPILTADHRVLGFIASQDPLSLTSTIYPISQLLASAERILKKGGDIYAGWLGLYVVDSNPAIGPGVLVQKVEKNSPAQRAGFFPGDFLLKFNGESLANIYHFVQLVEDSEIGSRARIDIVRRGNPMTVNAQIEARRIQPGSGGFSFTLPGAFGMQPYEIIPTPVPSNQRLLIGVDTVLINPQLAESLEIPAQSGLLVLDVQRNSPADRAGVLIGDVIVSIDGQSIKDGLEFVSYLQTHNWGDQAILQVNRKGTDLTITVQISD
jgi:S1-C subfamily serine protease